MSRTLRMLSAAALLAPILSGCADRGFAPKGGELRSEPACFVTPNSSRCKFLHDLAGGAPFTLTGSSR